MNVDINEVAIYRKEIESLFNEFPRNIMVVLFVFSLITFQLLPPNYETIKSVCEGIISGFVFYFLIEVFPSAAKKINILNRFANETGRIESYFQHLIFDLKEELKQTGQVVPVEDKFFDVLQTLNITYMPQSTNVKQIFSTQRTPTGINFTYANLGNVLDSYIYQVQRKIIYYNKIADIYGLNDLDADIAEIIRSLENLTLNPKNTIAQIGHIGNNASFYGTELDIIREQVKKVQDQLKAKWFTEILF
ncbi:MAG: hypothetical protein HYV97_02785 [Bdellovibrio sp.]|nr:hypothetical protein [Bdellovibrio sp.]